MKIIKYNLCTRINRGTEEKPKWEEILSLVTMDWCEENEEVAKREAHNGKYTVEDDGYEDQPTQLDRVEAQITYTAMMTDTLLEV